MNHLEVWELEKAWEAGDAAWLKYVADIERLIGRDLDGDEGDGLSLDGAHKAWRSGISSRAYVGCAHESATTADGHGACCKHCGDTLA